MKKNILVWVNEAIMEIKKSGLSQDIHFDELENMEVNCQNDIILFSNNISHLLRNEFYGKIPTNLSISIGINLISESHKFLGLPTSFDELLSRIDLFDSPNIVVYKKDCEFNYNIEMYRSCIPYEMGNIDVIDILYREYRDCESLIENDWYTREIVYYIL